MNEAQRAQPDALASSAAERAAWLSRLLGALLRRSARCEARLQAFTMLLPDGQMAVSCCQRLAELIGYSAPGETGDREACSS